MSRPPFVHLPPRVRAVRLATRRGDFAVLDAEPPDTAVRRGTILLVPGFTGSKEDFIAVLAPLAEAGYRAVAVDGRGQHETPAPEDAAGYRIGALAQDVLAQVAALGGPVHLVGHSLGGLICRGAVLRAPSAAHSLTLVSSGPGRCARWPRWRLVALRTALPFVGADRLWQLLHRGESTAAEVTAGDPVAGFLRLRWGSTSPGQLYATGRQLRYEPDRVDQLAAIGAPVHVLSGQRDGVWPVPVLDAMAARLSARRTVISGAEHSPNAERPAATAAALLDFFLDIDAAGRADNSGTEATVAPPRGAVAGDADGESVGSTRAGEAESGTAAVVPSGGNGVG